MSGTHGVFQHRTGVISGVYAHLDPRDKSIRYVGMSVDIIRRFKQHLQLDDNNEAKNTWLRELQATGLQPILAILEIVEDRGQLWQREQYWIAYYREQGEPLTNVPMDLPQVPDFWVHGLDDHLLEARVEP